MAEEILNKLGFDVTQALSALKQLDTQLQTSAGTFKTHATQLSAWNTQARAALATMKAMGTAGGKAKLPAVTPPPVPTGKAGVWPPADLNAKIQQAIALTKKYGGSVSVAGEKVRVSGMKGAEALDKASKSAKNLGVSFQMIGRIISTQMIVRLMSQIRNALRESVTAAIDFQKAISEIKAIAPITATFQSLQAEAAALSTKFNIPLPDVAEGLYQSISNQFVEVADRSRIMSAAMKLSRVGCMSLGDAVLLLTGTLNAYGESSSNVELVAAKFFRTIQLGRVRGKELANVMGQVNPIASNLGITLDEVNSSFVSMTIGGLAANKAATGLRGAMMAFLKPSERMKEILRELGYANAEQIIQAKGWMGALQAVADASGNMATEFGKSLRRIRALTAGLSLTRDEAKKYEEAMVAMSEVSSESLEALYAQFVSMPAEKLTKSINALKVALTQDFGNAIVSALGGIIELSGGADKLAAGLQALAYGAGILGTALVILAAKAALASIALGPIGWTIAAVVTAVALLTGGMTYRSAMAVANIRNEAEARRNADLEELKSLEEKQRKEMTSLRERNKERNKLWQEGMAEVRKLHFKAIDALKEKNKELIGSTRETLNSIVAAQGRVVSAYRNAAKAAVSAVIDSRAQQMQAEIDYSDTVFKYAHKNEKAYQKAEAYMRRARFLAQEAQRAMRAAKTPEQIAAARAVFERAGAAAEVALQEAEGTKSVKLQEDAQRQVLFVMRQKSAEEKKLQALQAKQAGVLAKQAADEQKRLNTMKSLMGTILTDLQAFSKEGAKDPKTLKAQQERLTKNVKDLHELWLRGPKADVTEMLALDKLQQRVQTILAGGVSEFEIRKLRMLPGTFADAREQIEKGIGPVRVMFETVIPKLPAHLRKELKGATAEEALSIFSREAAKFGGITEEYKDMGDKFVTANENVSSAKDRAKAALDEWAKQVDFTGKMELIKGVEAGYVEEMPWMEAFTDFADAVTRFTNLPAAAIDESEYERLTDAYEDLLIVFSPPAGAVKALETFAREAGAISSAAKSRMQLLEGLKLKEKGATEATRIMPLLEKGLEAAKQKMQDAERVIKRVKQDTADAGGKLSDLSTVDMTNLVGQAGQLAANMWSTARASQQIQWGSQSEYTAHGGRAGRYLTAGGPVGTDVVPAMLSRGEVVMNAGASQQFASQLAAMNAGVRPVFRSEGGSVTTIGDISVTVSGGETGRQTGRSIAAELRRELRRGTTTL